MDNTEMDFYKRHIIIYLCVIGIGILILFTGLSAHKFEPELGIIFPIVICVIFSIGGLIGLILLLIDFLKKD